MKHGAPCSPFCYDCQVGINMGGFMPGLGTVINVALLIAGGLLGLIGGRFITPRIQDTLMKASGLCVLFIGLGGTMQKMLVIDGKALETTGTTMLIVGEAINLEAGIENLGEWLKRKTGSEGDNEFTNAFVSASLTVCIGAMAIVGSIQDGLLGDWSTLALKGALDCIIVCTMTASLGRGCIFSALPVAVFQGTITLFAGALSPIMTTAALNSLSLVGSMLIFCVGVNLIRPQTFRTANMLPSVVIAVIYALLV